MSFVSPESLKSFKRKKMIEPKVKLTAMVKAAG
jgi:hypothetical protein